MRFLRFDCSFPVLAAEPPNSFHVLTLHKKMLVSLVFSVSLCLVKMYSGLFCCPL
jgi:hypothetical protein